MSVFYLFLFFTLPVSWAQQDYFTPQNKAYGIRHFKEKVYHGCSDLKEKQEPVSPSDLALLVSRTKNLVSKSFSKAFAENPQVKNAFLNDVDSLARESSCQKEGNDCRARLLSLAMYYYQNLRIDLPQCMELVSDQELCESEKKFRKSSLQGVQFASYGSSGVGNYKKHLMKAKNELTSELFKIIIQKDKKNTHICNPVLDGIVHRYTLDLDEPGNYYEGLDPYHDPLKKMVQDCKQDKETLHREFIEANFDNERSTVGQDQVEPLKQKISEFIKSRPELIVTDVIVTASSSKTPLYKLVNGKKAIDPQSNERNLSVVNERARYISKMLSDLKASGSHYENINFNTRAELAGPEFQMVDLNDRFVTRMTPGYFEKIERLHKKYKKDYGEKAMKSESTELFDEKKYVNLYQAKFKPFHGFGIVMKGYKKNEMKCADFEQADKKVKSSASKQ